MRIATIHLVDAAKRLVVADDEARGFADRIDLTGAVFDVVGGSGHSLRGIVEDLVDRVDSARISAGFFHDRDAEHASCRGAK